MLLNQQSVLKMQDIKPAISALTIFFLQRQQPADERFSRLHINEHIFIVKPHLSVLAGKLRLKGLADRRFPLMARAIEFVIDRVIGKIRHNRFEIVAVECLGKFQRQFFQLPPRHHILRLCIDQA